MFYLEQKNLHFFWLNICVWLLIPYSKGNHFPSTLSYIGCAVFCTKKSTHLLVLAFDLLFLVDSLFVCVLCYFSFQQYISRLFSVCSLLFIMLCKCWSVGAHNWWIGVPTLNGFQCNTISVLFSAQVLIHCSYVWLSIWLLIFNELWLKSDILHQTKYYLNIEYRFQYRYQLSWDKKHILLLDFCSFDVICIEPNPT